MNLDSVMPLPRARICNNSASLNCSKGRPSKSVRVRAHGTGSRHGTAPVLVYLEMEEGRSPLVSIQAFALGFFKATIRPPGNHSAWLRPRRARFRFARQDHCSSTASHLPQLPVGPSSAHNPVTSGYDRPRGQSSGASGYKSLSHSYPLACSTRLR